jgi:hypothetical protein
MDQSRRPQHLAATPSGTRRLPPEISAGQVSAKNELDTANDIYMSFFIIYDSSEYKLAFRNGGSFSGLKRVSYMVIDSVSETAPQS